MQSAAPSSASFAITSKPIPFRGTARQRPRVAPRREPRPRAVHSLAPQRAHERRRPGGLRLAAGLRPYHRGRVPHHRRVWPVAAPGVHIRAFKMLVQFLHLRFAIGPAPGRAAPSRPVPQVRPARTANRPHPVAHTAVSAGPHRHPGRDHRRDAATDLQPANTRRAPAARRINCAVAAPRTRRSPRPRGSPDGGASSRGSRPSCASSRSRRPRTRRSRR